MSELLESQHITNDPVFFDAMCREVIRLGGDPKKVVNNSLWDMKLQAIINKLPDPIEENREQIEYFLDRINGYYQGMFKT